jgi:hypothetical protein
MVEVWKTMRFTPGEVAVGDRRRRRLAQPGTIGID